MLRQFPFDAIAEDLSRRGLVSSRLEGRLFPQRLFRDEAEMAGAIAAVETLGLDPTGLEAEGRYFAEFHLAAPEGAVDIDRLAP